MWILDQSKSNFVNCDRVINIGLEEKSTLVDEINIAAETDGYRIVLGKYKNEDRAREILEDLIRLYRKNFQVIGERGGVTDFIYPPKVYEMPKE